MNQKSALLFLVTLLLVSSGASAQIKKRQAVLITRIGDDYYAEGEYKKATYYYKVAFNEYPQYVKAQFQIAQCYRLTQQYDSAEHHYGAIIADGQDFRFPLARYHLAMLQLEKQQLDAALTNLKTFRSLVVVDNQHEREKFSEYYQQSAIAIEKINVK